MSRVLDFNDTQSSATTPTPLSGRLVTGSEGSPEQITAGGGITVTATGGDEMIFIEGSGGAVNITANPQISAGAFVGQCIVLIGRSDTNTVTLDDGDGLDLNGTIELFLNTIIELIWSGTTWLEKSRKE
jgi:hypothetical protein